MVDGSDARQVTLANSFEIGVYEVTQEQYAVVMGTNPSEFEGGRNPVENVNWEDAVEFCRRLSELPAEQAAGQIYRLPSGAEWEYACRAGTTTVYSFGDDESKLGEYGWYDGNSNSKIHPVGQKKPNSWGLYDMHGNAWEWCQDSQEDDISEGRVTRPTSSASVSIQVSRGGSWGSSSGGCRTANRFRLVSSYRNDSLGFRVVCVSAGQ